MRFTEATVDEFVDRMGGLFRHITTVTVHPRFLVLFVQDAEFDYAKVRSERC